MFVHPDDPVPTCPADLGYRLLGLTSLGVYLEGRDGHVWIEPIRDAGEDYDTTSGLARLLRANGVSLNNKIYGGVLEALDTIDEALRRCDRPNLLEHYVGGDYRALFLGKPGVDASRITQHEPNTGGIY